MQKLTGRDSTPVARDNAPISIFAKEEKKSMTRKAAAQAKPEETTPVAAEPTTVAAAAETTATAPTPDLKALREQRRALAEQIKAAKAATKAAQPAKVAAPKLSALDAVIARQATITRKWLPETLAWRVSARVKAGQPQAEALEAVFAQVRAAVEVLLAAPATSEEPTAE